MKPQRSMLKRFTELRDNEDRVDITVLIEIGCGDMSGVMHQRELAMCCPQVLGSWKAAAAGGAIRC